MDIDINADLGIAIGEMTNQLKQIVNKHVKRGQRPVPLRIPTTFATTAGGALVSIPVFGSPSQGYRWVIRQWGFVSLPVYNTLIGPSGASCATLYRGSPPPTPAIVGNASDVVGVIDPSSGGPHSTSGPFLTNFNSTQIVVRANDKVYMDISGWSAAAGTFAAWIEVDQWAESNLLQAVETENYG